MKTRTKKSAFASLVVALALLAATLGGGTLLFAQTDSGEPDSTTVVADRDWKTGAGTIFTEYDTETGYSHVQNVNVNGANTTYQHKVKLDGLTIDFLIDTGEIGVREMVGTIGFGFTDKASVPAAEYPYRTPDFCASYLMKIYDKQTRFYIGTDNNSAKHSIVSHIKDDAINNRKGADKEGNGFKRADSYIFSHAGRNRMIINFSYEEDIKVWTIECSAEDFSAWGGQATTVYFHDDYVRNVLDEKGETYITVCGFPSGDAGKPGYETYLTAVDGYLKIEDDNIRTYKASAVVAADEAVTAYDTAIEAVSDMASYNASVLKREELVEAINALRGNDKYSYEARLSELDGKYTQSADVQAKVRAAVQTAFTQAAEKVEVLATEADINAENLQAAETALGAAVSAFENAQGRLTTENQQYFNGLGEDYAYAISLASAKQWIIAYETAVAALADKTEAELVDAIVSVKAQRAEFEGSEAAEIIGALKESDKIALNDRITAADELVAATERENEKAVKSYYISLFETAVSKDMLDKNNVDAAKTAYEDLLNKVAVAESDGALFERYSAAYNSLKTACENIVLANIEKVDALLNGSFEKYSEFAPINEKYAALDLQYVVADSERVNAAHEALTLKLKKNVFSAVAVENSDVEQTERGLYTEQTENGSFGWLENLAANKEISVVVSLDEAAFYTAGTLENAIWFKFSEADGERSVTLKLVLNPTFSTLQAYCGNTIADVKELDTPENGTALEFKFVYANGCKVSMNGLQFELSAEQLGGDADLTNVTFSFGTIANNDSFANCLTLVSINGKNLASEPTPPENPEEPSEPENPDNPNKPQEPSEPEKPEEPAPKKKKCGSTVSGTAAAFTAAIMLLGAATLVVRGKKKNAK
ncbi:MAG: phage tail tape measure protein [Clostridia bacterium]|nr:phage tail tape measure protein [Clostridia bacterium]